MYDYERAHEELEDRSTLKVPPRPMHQNRPSSERSSRTQLHQYA
jgi:hypothetical protein